MPVEDVALSALVRDPRAQPRAQLSLTLVGEYAEDMARGAQFPPVVAFRDDDGQIYLASGWHRAAAAAAAGRTTLAADIREGGLRAAILFAAGSNADHGLRRTNADKRRAVETLLSDPEWRQWSDREIARRCAVDQKTVAAARRDLELTEEIPQSPPLRRGADGRVIDTTNIGRRPEPTPAPRCGVCGQPDRPEHLCTIVVQAEIPGHGRDPRCAACGDPLDEGHHCPLAHIGRTALLDHVTQGQPVAAPTTWERPAGPSADADDPPPNDDDDDLPADDLPAADDNDAPSLAAIADANDEDGEVARTRLLAQFTRGYAASRTLLMLSPNAIAGVLPRERQTTVRLFCADLRAWCDELEREIGAPVRLVGATRGGHERA